MKTRKFLFSIIISVILGVTAFSCYAIDGEGDVRPPAVSATVATSKAPFQYAVYQQQGPTCPYISWENLQKVRAMRERGSGQIVLNDADYVTKVHSYAWFFPRIHTLDRLYEVLRRDDGDYALYEKALRAEGITSIGRYSAEGIPIDEIDESPFDRKRRASYSPYNIRINTTSVLRQLPLFIIPGEKNLFYYSYTSRTTRVVPIVEGERQEESDVFLLSQFGFHAYRFDSEMLQEMGIGKTDFSNMFLANNKCYIPASGERGDFYDVGSYQHILFACGLKADNTLFDERDTSLAARASRELRTALSTHPLNPWARITRGDLFEYHLAEIFRTNSRLKEMAMKSVNFFNRPWVFYKESFALFDSAQEFTRKRLSLKQDFMPGEEQMLAYYFSGELHALYAASISVEAVVATLELEDMSSVIGPDIIQSVIDAAAEQQYPMDSSSYSFLDIWSEIRKVFVQTIINTRGEVDFVSFNGHGSVMSFDMDLVGQQPCKNRDLLRVLGFVRWDSYYAEGLTPFYRRPGTHTDFIEFGHTK